MREIKIKDKDIKPDHKNTCLMCALGLDHEIGEGFLKEMDSELFDEISNKDISSSETIVRLMTEYSKAELALILEGVVYSLAVQRGYIEEKRNPIEDLADRLIEEVNKPKDESQLFKSIFNDIKDRKSPI